MMKSPISATRALAGLLLVGGCSVEDDDPDGPDRAPGACSSDLECGANQSCVSGSCVADQAPEPTCSDEGRSCEANGDCCEFDGSTDVGAGLCVNNGQQAECTSICRSGGDCSSGCCVALAEEDEFGACAPASACDDAASEACVLGVIIFCACVDVAEPCTDQDFEDFFATCEQPGNEVAEAFECIAAGNPDTVDECIDVLDSCIPTGTADLRSFRFRAPSAGSLPEDEVASFAVELGDSTQ